MFQLVSSSKWHTTVKYSCSLFIIVIINDLPDVYDSICNILLSADHAKIFRHIKSSANNKDSQNDIKEVQW